MQSTTVCKEQSSVLKQMMFFHKLDSLFFFFNDMLQNRHRTVWGWRKSVPLNLCIRGDLLKRYGSAQAEV